MATGNEQVFRLGEMQMTVRPLSDGSVTGVAQPFVALLPATDLTRLPMTTSVVPELLRSGCVDIILAGSRAEAFHEQIGLVIQQSGVTAASSPYSELGDACNAALLGALIHHSGLALCLEAPELLETLRGHSLANGWTMEEAPANAMEPPEKKAPEKKLPVKKAAAKPVPAKKAPAKKPPAKKAPAKKAKKKR